MSNQTELYTMKLEEELRLKNNNIIRLIRKKNKEKRKYEMIINQLKLENKRLRGMNKTYFDYPLKENEYEN